MKIDPIVMRKMAIVLSIIAMVTMIAAIVIGYVRKGEVNLLLLAPFFIIFAASLIIYGGAKKKSDK